MLTDAGVTAIDFNVLAVTVNGVVPVIPLTAALMFVEPAIKALATPEAEMLAIDGVLDVQVTEPLMFCVVVSE
jgi:hypothetical protein